MRKIIIHIYTHICIYINIYTYMCTHTYIIGYSNKIVSLFCAKCKCIYIYTCIYVCMHLHTCVCVFSVWFLKFCFPVMLLNCLTSKLFFESTLFSVTVKKPIERSRWRVFDRLFVSLSLGFFMVLACCCCRGLTFIGFDSTAGVFKSAQSQFEPNVFTSVDQKPGDENVKRFLQKIMVLTLQRSL